MRHAGRHAGRQSVGTRLEDDVDAGHVEGDQEARTGDEQREEDVAQAAVDPAEAAVQQHVKRVAATVVRGRPRGHVAVSAITGGC